MSNVQKFAKFLKNFDEYKAQIASKFAFITFAQYCTFSGWLQHVNKSSSIKKNCIHCWSDRWVGCQIL